MFFLKTLKKNNDFSNETFTLIVKLLFELSTYQDNNSLKMDLNSSLIENLLKVNFLFYL